MGRVTVRITFSNAASESSSATASQQKPMAASTFFTMHKFSSLLETERKEEVLDDVPQTSHRTGLHGKRLRVRRLTSHIH